VDAKYTQTHILPANIFYLFLYFFKHTGWSVRVALNGSLQWKRLVVPELKQGTTSALPPFSEALREKSFTSKRCSLDCSGYVLGHSSN